MPPELVLIAVLLAAGAVAGLTAGLFGIGGGAVMVPALFFALGALGYDATVTMHVAVATSAAVIIVNGLRSSTRHARLGSVDHGILALNRPLVSWGVWIGVGAFVAATLVAPRLSGQALTLLFVALAVGVGLQFIFGRPDVRLLESVPGGAAPALGGSVIGGLSALMGIGGGSISVPLMRLAGVPMHRAVGTAAAIGVLIAVPATLGYMISGQGVAARPPGTVGYVNIWGFAAIVSASLPAVPLGVRLAHRLDAAVLQRTFGVLLLVIAANMARQAL